MKLSLFEASMARIIKDFEDGQFAIITAWRQKNTKSVNKKNLNSMIDEIKSNGFGVTSVWGHGQEEINGKQVSVKEPSLVIKNLGSMSEKEFEKYIINLSQAFDQWGVVIHNANEVKLVQTKNDDGTKMFPKVVQTFKSSHVGDSTGIKKITSFFTSLKGKSFFFEGYWEYGRQYDGWIHGFAEDSKWRKSLNEIIEKYI